MQNNYKCKIFIWDKLVGEMVLVKGSIYFKYDESFDLNISPLSMKLSKAQYNFDSLHFQYAVPGVFADSLPDSFGMKIIDKYFSDTYENFVPNIIDKLLFVGDVTLGALTYKPSMFQAGKKTIPILLKETKEFKKSLLEKNTYKSLRHAIDMYRSFSPAGGAKEKLILSYSQKHETFYLGKAKAKDKSLLVKVDESEYPHYGAKSIIEYIYSKVAASCGITMPNTYLFTDTLGYIHYAIERFDIDKNKERLHTHTLAGLLHMEKSTAIDYANIFTIAKQKLLLRQDDIDELYRRMVFNFIYNNNDDHLKNTTFLMDKKGSWRVSPAYDLTYNNTVGQREMILKINSKLSSQIGYEDFAALGKAFGVNYDAILKEIKKSEELFLRLIDHYTTDTIKYDLLEIKQLRKLS